MRLKIEAEITRMRHIRVYDGSWNAVGVRHCVERKETCVVTFGDYHSRDSGLEPIVQFAFIFHLFEDRIEDCPDATDLSLANLEILTVTNAVTVIENSGRQSAILMLLPCAEALGNHIRGGSDSLKHLLAEVK